MSARVTSHRTGWGGERSKRLPGYRLPDSKADWIARIAEAEDRSVPEITSFLVQQGLKIYERGSLLCNWPDCKRRHCGCSGAATAGKVSPPSVPEEPRTNVLSFPPPEPAS